jgi:hypothetical protein
MPLVIGFDLVGTTVIGTTVIALFIGRNPRNILDDTLAFAAFPLRLLRDIEPPYSLRLLSLI